MKCYPAINFTRWFIFIFILYILSAYISANIKPIAEEIQVKGEVHIKPSSIEMIDEFAIAGRSINNGDILSSTLGSQLEFQFTSADIQVISSDFSELRIDCDYASCQIKLNYGNLFIKSSSESHINFAWKRAYYYSLNNFFVHQKFLFLCSGKAKRFPFLYCYVFFCIYLAKFVTN